MEASVEKERVVGTDPAFLELIIFNDTHYSAKNQNMHVLGYKILTWQSSYRGLPFVLAWGGTMVLQFLVLIEPVI